MQGLNALKASFLTWDVLCVVGGLRAVSNTNEEPYRGTRRPPRADAGVDDMHTPSYGSKDLPQSTGWIFCCHRGLHLPVGPFPRKDMRPAGATRRQRRDVPQRVDACGAVVWLSTIIASGRLCDRGADCGAGQPAGSTQST